MANTWKFPITKGYQHRGLSANELDNKDSPTQTFVREVIQNSNDAHNAYPVKVEFDKFDLRTSDFPDLKGFKKTLELCRNETMSDSAETRDRDIYDSRIASVSADYMRVMRISDYNTTGLLGSDSNQRDTPWNAATVGKGVTPKNGSSGGSKGRGKESFYRMSEIGCVFFSTLDKNGKEASIGCSYQITHGDSDGTHEDFGCYNDENDEFSRSQLFLQPGYVRNQAGTDIYIPAFQMEKNIAEQIKMAATRDFYVSILEGKLIIYVFGEKIDCDSLPNIINSLMMTFDSKSKNYKNLAILKEKIDCFKKGPVEATDDYDIYLRQSEYTPYVSGIRAGMTIKRDFIKLPERITGLVVIRSENASRLLIGAENISHTEWNVNNVDPKERQNVKKLLQRIHCDVKKEADKIAGNNKTTSLDVSGLAKYLPASTDKGDPKITMKEFSFDPIRNVRIAKKPLKKNDDDEYPSPQTKEKLSAEIVEDENRNTDEDTGPANHNPDPRPHELKRPAVVPSPENDYERVFKKAELKNVGYICLNSNSNVYRVVFTSKISGRICLKIGIIMSDGKPGDSADVISAEEKNGETLPITEGKIGPLNVVKNEGYSMKIKIDYPISCRIELEGEIVDQ